MDGRYVNSKNSTKAPKLKSLNADISPLNPNSHSQNFNGRGRRPKSSIFDPYASSSDRCSDSPNMDSSLFRYLCLSSSSSSSSGGGSSRNRSRSEGQKSGGLLSSFPLASIQDLETPSKTLNVEEDVLVMDGILVDNDRNHRINNSKAAGSARLRSPLTSSGSSGRSGLSTASSDGNLTSFYEREKRVPRDDSGTPRYVSKCYIGQENEELRSLRHLSKKKSEEKLCKAFISGSCAYGARCRFVHHLVKSPLSTEPASTAKALPRAAATISPITTKKATSSENNMTTPALTAINDWSPLDDGIECALPSAFGGTTPTREDVDAHIHTVLYGPSVRKRLPVFREICPE